MNNITFNRSTNIVTGLNRPSLPYEYQVNLPFSITLSKSIQVPTNQLIQKTNSENLPLYKDEVTIDEITGEESYIETTNSQKVTKYESVTNTYKIVIGEEMVEQTNEFGEIVLVPVPIYDEIVTTSEIPIAWDELEPIMIPEVITKTVTFPDQYMEFDYEEVLEAKKLSINNNSLTSLCYYDEDFLGNDLILSNCSIGDGFISIMPNGSVATPIIQLPKFTTIIELYTESHDGLVFKVNDTLVENNRVKLPTQTDKITISVSNPTNKNLELYCLGGLC